MREASDRNRLAARASHSIARDRGQHDQAANQTRRVFGNVSLPGAVFGRATV